MRKKEDGESAPSTAAREVDLAELMEQFRGRMSDASLTALIEIGAQGNPRVRSSLVWLCTNSMGQQLMLSIGDSVDGDAIVSAVETLRATTGAAPSLVDEVCEVCEVSFASREMWRKQLALTVR